MRYLLPITCAFGTALATSASAVTIDNDMASGTLGYVSADIDDAGETRNVSVTVNGANRGLTTVDVVFAYYTYVDLGLGGVRLSDTVTSSATSAGDDAVVSSGELSGISGNTITWSAETSIADNSNLLVNVFTFSALSGTLGDLQLFQYLDEDVLGNSDDVFFTRGSSAGGDLELYTVDADEVVGISHGGAYSAAQGLVNASFDGWAADTYNNMAGRIASGNQITAPDGMIENSLMAAGTLDINGLGTTLGPEDIVSSMAWTVDANATTATIITSLGGVPDISFVAPVTPPVIVTPPVAAVPLPAALPMALAGLAALGALGRRRRS